MQRLHSSGILSKPWGLSKGQEAFLMLGTDPVPHWEWFILMSKSFIKLLEKFTPQTLTWFYLDSRHFSVHHRDVCMSMWSCLWLEKEVPIYYIYYRDSWGVTKILFISPVIFHKILLSIAGPWSYKEKLQKNLNTSRFVGLRKQGAWLVM